MTKSAVAFATHTAHRGSNRHGPQSITLLEAQIRRPQSSLNLKAGDRCTLLHCQSIASKGWKALDNAFTTFAPPHHECRHEQSDENGYHNEWAQDGVWGVSQQPSRDRAVFEVVLVNCYEELIH